MGRKFIFDGLTMNDAIGVGVVVVGEPFLNQLIQPLTSKLNLGTANIQVDDIAKVILGGYMVGRRNPIISSSGKALVIIGLARVFSGLYNKIRLTTTTVSTNTITSVASSSANMV